MSKTIVIEYTDPVTGSQKTKQVTVDIERYRKDTELGPVEDFFLKGSATGAGDVLESLNELVADILDGKPSSARYQIIQSLIDAAFTAMGATLAMKGNPITLGFVASVPCVVMDKYGRVKDWFIPTSVGSSFLTIPTSGEAALSVNCEVNWIVQKAAGFASPLGENSQPGVKAQSERPTTPTAVTGSGSVSGGINVSWTKPSDAVIQYYDIYVIKADVVPTVIEPNDRPTILDRAANLASSAVNCTQRFDESDMTLKSLIAGNYFVGVVAKDGAGHIDINESAIGWSAMVTIA